MDYPFTRTDIARWHVLDPEPGVPAIDDATWNDLLLDAYHARLAQQTSIFGQQWLYRRLRGGMDPATRAAGIDAVNTLVRDPARFDAAEHALRGLREADAEASDVLYGAPVRQPRWSRHLWLATLIVPLSLAGFLFTNAAWVGAMAGMLLLILLQMHFYEASQAWKRVQASLQRMLHACDRLGDNGRARALAARLRPSPADALPLLKEYREWFGLSNVRHYLHCMRVVAEARDLLRHCFARVAEADGHLALARHLRAAPRWCIALETADRELALRGLRHPLLMDAQALDLTLAAPGTFLSGPNGVGKSTLLRAVGLNVVAARAFGFAYADEARVPSLGIRSSIDTSDSLLGGESLYMAELRRARELLDGPPCLYLVDEVFRGTNHLESVSAAAAVLGELARRGLLLVASHHLLLAAALGPALARKRLQRVEGKLVLEQGTLEATNGLAMLSEYGFGARIEEEAARVFALLHARLAEAERGLALAAAATPGQA